MATDVMMTTEQMMYEDATDQSPIITGSKLCFNNLNVPLIPRISIYTVSLIFSAFHLLVIIVCVRERKKATYKHDIVYMVGLAIVDMTFLLSTIIVQPGARKTGALTSLTPLILVMSVMLLALRAVDRFNIFIRKQAKPWSFRFQIVLCLVSNVFVTVPITYSALFTDIPFILIFWCIVSLIILVSYSTIVCKLLLKARKSRLQISPTQPSRLFRRHIAGGKSSRGTATDENAGISSIKETGMTFVEPLQNLNVAMSKHSSVQPDHVVEEKTLHQMTNIEVITAETSNQMRNEHKVLDIATTSSKIGKENNEHEVAIATTSSHIGKENGEVAIATTSNHIGKENGEIAIATTSNHIGQENGEVAIATTSNQIGQENGEVAIATTSNQIGKENEEVAIVETSKHIGKKHGEVAIEKTFRQTSKENWEMVIMKTNSQMGNDNDEVAIVHKSKHMGNESKEMVTVQTIRYPGRGKKEEVIVQNSTQSANINKNVFPVQKSEKFGKKKVGMRLEVRQNSAHIGKDKRTEVPVHVNRNQILITKRNKGNHIRSASLALVCITIIFYLSWFPTWLVNIWDGAPCNLLLIVYVNSIVNPFVYLITLKTFRKASYNLISMFFRRLCKSN